MNPQQIGRHPILLGLGVRAAHLLSLVGRAQQPLDLERGPAVEQAPRQLLERLPEMGDAANLDPHHLGVGFCLLDVHARTVRRHDIERERRDRIDPLLQDGGQVGVGRDSLAREVAQVPHGPVLGTSERGLDPVHVEAATESGPVPHVLLGRLRVIDPLHRIGRDRHRPLLASRLRVGGRLDGRGLAG